MIEDISTANKKEKRQKAIAFRPSKSQRQWILEQAAAMGKTVSKFIRLVLIEKGMPTT